MQSQAVYTAARLGLADALAAGPLPAAELAVAVGAKEGHLRRLLRLLVLLGIFTEPEPGACVERQAADGMGVLPEVPRPVDPGSGTAGRR